MQDVDQDEVSIIGLLKPLWSHRRFIVLATMTMTLLAVGVAAIHYLSQPVRWTAELEFRPLFEGAALGKYPNGLPFAPSDITDPSVVGAVYDQNKLDDLCPRGAFQSGFFVQEQSSELQLIDADYQSQLADTKLTGVDRQRLMDQYQAKRKTAPVQYRLTFVRPDACRNLPAVVVYKVIDEILLTWAQDSEAKRGVLKQRVDLLTPSVFDSASTGHQSFFVRANLLWKNLDRIIHNITTVDALPGAGLVRIGQEQISLAEVKARLEDLQNTRLEALIGTIGARDPSDGRWLQAALETAVSEQQIADDRAQANLDALREYTGATPALKTTRRETGSAAPADSPFASAQIDKSLLDQLMELSVPNTTFRQDMTVALVKSRLDAVDSEALVDHYRQLQKALLGGGGSASGEDLNAALTDVANQGKALTKQFDDIYDEWSRVSFRPGPALYRVDTPASTRVVRPFTLFNYLTVVGIVFFVTLLFAALAALARTHIWPAIVARTS